MFISMFYGVVDPKKGRLRLRQHRAPARIRDQRGGHRDPALRGGSAARDGRRSAEHRVAELDSAKDLLVLFTDGISDARNGSDERLGEERVLELIKENRDNDTKAILERVFELLEVHTRSVPSRDDLTLVVVRS